MPRFRDFRVVLAVGVCASLLGFVRRAVACSPPPNGWFAYAASFDVPQNGVVPVQYLCYAACESPPDPETFTLSDGAGSEVPGSVVLTGGGDTQRYLVWKPDAELALGSYTATLTGVSFGELYQAVGAISFGPITPVASIYPIDRKAGDEVCCSGPVDSCGGRPCFHTEIARAAGLSVDFGTGDVVEDGQYAHRFVPEDDSGDPIWTFSGALAGYEIELEGTSTCYTLELLRLVDGFVERFEERCIDAPETLATGVHANPPEDIASVLSRCEAAPDGFDDEWCDAHAERCATPNATFCDVYTATCSGEDGETTIRTEGCGCTLPGKTVPVGSVAAMVALALGSLAARRRIRMVRKGG